LNIILNLEKSLGRKSLNGSSLFAKLETLLFEASDDLTWLYINIRTLELWNLRIVGW